MNFVKLKEKIIAFFGEKYTEQIERKFPESNGDFLVFTKAEFFIFYQCLFAKMSTEDFIDESHNIAFYLVIHRDSKIISRTYKTQLPETFKLKIFHVQSLTNCIEWCFSVLTASAMKNFYDTKFSNLNKKSLILIDMGLSWTQNPEYALISNIYSLEVGLKDEFTFWLVRNYLSRDLSRYVINNVIKIQHFYIPMGGETWTNRTSEITVSEISKPQYNEILDKSIIDSLELRQYYPDAKLFSNGYIYNIDAFCIHSSMFTEKHYKKNYDT